MIKFENGENIIKIVRRHYLVLLPMVFALVIGALAPMILLYFLTSGFIPFNTQIVASISSFLDGYKIFAYALWLLALWLIFFIEWSDYYLDIWILTDRRIIDVEQMGFFHREVTSFNYDQIQDITVETRGLIETFFKFGTLHIQTAGHNRDIIIRDAHYPEDARILILKLQQKYKSIQNL